MYKSSAVVEVHHNTGMELNGSALWTEGIFYTYYGNVFLWNWGRFYQISEDQVKQTSKILQDQNADAIVCLFFCFKYVSEL